MEWFSLFPKAGVVVELVDISGHGAQVIHLQNRCSGQQDRRRFCFKESWAREEAYGNVIKRVWRSKKTNERNLQTIHRNLERCRKGIMKWQNVEKQRLSMEVNKK